MSRKFGILLLVWVFVIFAYVLLAFTHPTLLSVTETTVTTMQASSNMTRYPGTVAFVRMVPLLVWFIPGGVALVATAVYFKIRD
jgi:hypothetical protein